jgi:hypothetical protein
VIIFTFARIIPKIPKARRTNGQNNALPHFRRLVALAYRPSIPTTSLQINEKSLKTKLFSAIVSAKRQV